jgi:hypothetical protein
MLKKILLITLLPLLFVACKSKKAYYYSEDIVKKERSLAPDIERTENSVKEYLDGQQYDSIAIVSERMEKLVDNKLEEIKAMNPPSVKEADNFKQAAIRYFAFMKSVYTTYKEIGGAQDSETRQAAILKFSDIEEQKNKAVADMQRAQKKYADANGFKIED